MTLATNYGVIASAGVEAAPPSTTALLLHCDGTNGSTSFPDSSPNGHTVTPVGNAQVTTTSPKFGTGALACDGTGDGLSIADHASFGFGTGPVTIEGWTYFDSTGAGSYRWLVGKGTSPNNSFTILSAADNKFDIYLSSDGTNWNIVSAGDGGAVPQDQWFHWALVRDGNVWTFYVDGISTWTTTDAAALYQGTAPVDIGVRQSDSFGGWKGKFDEVRIKTEAVYTTGFTPPTGAFPDT